MTHHGSSALKRVLALEKLSTYMEKRPFFPGAEQRKRAFDLSERVQETTK